MHIVDLLWDKLVYEKYTPLRPMDPHSYCQQNDLPRGSLTWKAFHTNLGAYQTLRGAATAARGTQFPNS